MAARECGVLLSISMRGRAQHQADRAWKEELFVRRQRRRRRDMGHSRVARQLGKAARYRPTALSDRRSRAHRLWTHKDQSAPHAAAVELEGRARWFGGKARRLISST